MFIRRSRRSAFRLLNHRAHVEIWFKLPGLNTSPNSWLTTPPRMNSVLAARYIAIGTMECGSALRSSPRDRRKPYLFPPDLLSKMIELPSSEHLECAPVATHLHAPHSLQLACSMVRFKHGLLTYSLRVDQPYREGTARLREPHTQVQSADLPLVGREQPGQPEPP